MGNVREIPVDIGGRTYNITSDDNYLEHIRNGFEPETVRLFRLIADGSRSVLDIGANIGCTALLLAPLARSVHAFEPSPTTFAFLSKNISASGHSNIVAHNVGLGEESGDFPLTFAPSNRSGGFVSNHTNASVGHSIEHIRIQRTDQAIADLAIRQIDFIKVDVEGFEGHVLRGAPELLRTQRPVLALELNHWCLNAFQRTSVPEFFDQLRAIFPVLLAVDNDCYLNLHDESDRYVVMYQQILHMRFPTIVAGFDDVRLSPLRNAFKNSFTS